MLQGGVLKPVHEATPWINSFLFVEGKRQTRQSETVHLHGSNQFK